MTHEEHEPLGPAYVTHPDDPEINPDDFDRELKKSFRIKDRAYVSVTGKLRLHFNTLVRPVGILEHISTHAHV